MIFIDANVLIAHLLQTHPFHERAFRLFQNLVNGDETLVISPQIVGEIYCVITSRRMVSTPPPPERVKATIENLISDPSIEIVGPGRRAVEICLETAAARGLTSARVFDLLIYGTMREHDIRQLATFNVKDFQGLDGIELMPIP